MGFEKFTQVGGSYKPRLSIRANGQIGFNQGALNRFNLCNYKCCVLYFDRENNRIGVRFCNDEKEDGACKLQIKNKNGTVSAKAFLEYYAIGYKKSRAYDAVWDEEQKMIVVDIKGEN